MKEIKHMLLSTTLYCNGQLQNYTVRYAFTRDSPKQLPKHTSFLQPITKQQPKPTSYRQLITKQQPKPTFHLQTITKQQSKPTSHLQTITKQQPKPTFHIGPCNLFGSMWSMFSYATYLTSSSKNNW